MIRDLLLYAAPCWAINVGLNIWYLWKTRNPKVSRWDAPLDLGKKFFDGHRVLGQSTTWMGLPIALALGMALEWVVTDPLQGVLKGAGVYFGHAAGSFIKRRMNVPRGGYVPVIDHGDSLIVVGVLFWALDIVPLSTAILGLVITLIVQPVLTYAGYKLGLRDNPL